MPLSFSFWNDLKKAHICNWPSIIKKHSLTLSDIEVAGKLVKNSYLYDSWLNGLCIECFGVGILNCDKVFEKYEITEEERPGLKEELNKRFFSDDRSWLYKMFKDV